MARYQSGQWRGLQNPRSASSNLARASSMKKLYSLLVQNKNTITMLFLVSEFFVVGLWVAGFLLAVQQSEAVLFLVPFGGKIAQVSVFLYVLTLLPGMMKRLGFINPIQLSLMLFRKHLGILMFLTALLHMGSSFTFPVIASGQIPVFQPQIFSGFITIVLLLPLWLTSNDVSVKKMGVWWHRIHAFTYVALATIFIHATYMMSYKWSAVLGLVMIGEIASFFVAKSRKKQAVSKASSSLSALPETPSQ